MSENKILTKLPKWEEGRYKGKINWAKTINMELELLYQDKIYKVRVIKCNDGRLILEYKGYVKPEGISYRKFLKGSFGEVLNLRSKDFKVEIGQIFKDDKRDLLITDREYREKEQKPDKKGRVYTTKEKWYKYTCNKCGWKEGWIIEKSLLKDCGCSCCNGKTVVSEINSVWITHPWIIRLGVSEEDAKRCIKSSRENIEVICPNCKRKMTRKISNISRCKSIGCSCSDSISYSEKFITSMLSQLRIKFQVQLSNITFNWCNKYRYDFYLPEYNCIIETHGIQHYKYTGLNRTLEEEQENDKIKRELALNNSIKNYIVLDCRESDMKWIKNSVLNSKLNELLDLSNIDWNKCEEFALGNLVKEICEYWNNKKDWETTQTIAEDNEWGISARGTIRDYLKKGTKYGWCNYDAKEEKVKNAIKMSKSTSKQVEILKDGESLGTFISCHELDRKSKELFDAKLDYRKISNAVRNNKIYKGFTFRYIEDNNQQIAN